MKNDNRLNKLNFLLENSNGLSPFEVLEAYFQTVPLSMLKSRKLFLETIEVLREQSKITTEEASFLNNILFNRDDSKSYIDYEEYFDSFIGAKKKMPIEKTFPMVLMPFLVADSIDEILQIKKVAVRIEKTKRNMLLLYFSTPLGNYVVHINKYVKPYEQFFKEYLILGYKKEKDKELLFGRGEVSYSHQIRVLRERIEDTLGFYIHNQSNNEDKITNRTVLSRLMEDIRHNGQNLFFMQL